MWYHCIITLKVYKIIDLKRQFLFLHHLLSKFLKIWYLSVIIIKFTRLISLLRSPFVHKKFFEQFFYMMYTQKFSFTCGRLNYKELNYELFLLNCLLLPIHRQFFSKIEFKNKGTFFF